MPDDGCLSPFDGASRLCESCKVRGHGALKPCARVVAQSPAMRDVLRRAAPMAESTAPVVILGETGTGKEVLARALHASGPRAGKPFVAVNCGAIPAELIESELFGHLRGAFSGAVSDRMGLFEEASGGTLLLDEVAELPLPLQVKLLRALQDGQVRRVGANHPVDVDVRVLAATHRDLCARVASGAFREDLYYRLKVFTLRIPPLRDRPEDVLPLARSILVRLAGPATAFDAHVERILVAHRWPGNVRELGNAMRHAAAMARGARVEVGDLPEDLVDAVVRGSDGAPPAVGYGAPSAPGSGLLDTLAAVERRHILGVLEACHGQQARAARILGIARNTLWRRLEEYRRDGEREPANLPGE